MSSQFQQQFFPRSVVVQELEDRLATPGRNPEVAATYQQLCRDPAVVLAARYLALSAIANKLNLYGMGGDSARSLVQEISEHMNAVDPNKLLASIQHLKSYYPSLYRMNTLAFDTAANTAVDCIHRVIPQDPAVAVPQPDFAQPAVANWSQSPPPMDFAQPLVTINNQPTAASNHHAIIIGGSIVASSIVAGTFLAMSRSNVPQTATAVVSPSAMPSPTNLPTGVASAPSSPLAIPSVTKTVVPSYSASPVISPSGNSQPQANVLNSKASVIPMPIPTGATNGTRAASGATQDRNVAQQTQRVGASLGDSPYRAATNSPNTLKIVPPVTSSNSTANRPSPTGFINNYYSKLKHGQSQSAWQDLTPSLQGDRQANPGGYSGEYAKWWGGLGRGTQVGKVETVKTTAEAAVVQAHCRYGGKSYIAEYYLAFDRASQSWKIDLIKKLS